MYDQAERRELRARVSVISDLPEQLNALSNSSTESTLQYGRLHLGIAALALNVGSSHLDIRHGEGGHANVSSAKEDVDS